MFDNNISVFEFVTKEAKDNIIKTFNFQDNNINLKENLNEIPKEKITKKFGFKILATENSLISSKKIIKKIEVKFGGTYFSK